MMRMKNMYKKCSRMDVLFEKIEKQNKKKQTAVAQ